jgi:hypothetical protein
MKESLLFRSCRDPRRETVLLDSPRSPEDVLNQSEETLKDIVRRVGSSPVARGGSPSGTDRTAILRPSIDSGGPYVH